MENYIFPEPNPFVIALFEEQRKCEMVKKMAVIINCLEF